MKPPSQPFARFRQSLRFDGLWWRKFAYLGCVYGPEWWKRYSPPVIAAIIFALVGNNRRGAIRNMERILGVGGAPAVLAALKMYAEFAHCLTETMEYYGPRPRPLRLDEPTRDDLASALNEGHGAVVVSGHFGNWDVAAKTLREYGRPIHIVMASEVNASTHEYVRAARAQAGVQVIYSDSSVFSSLNMIRVLRRNEIVALQLDRSLGAGGMRPVAFFGAPALFPSGPFVLARLANAPLIPVFVPRLGTRHYAIRVAGRFDLPRDARDARSLERAMTQVVGAFEAVVHEFPLQWFQFTPFWSDATDAAPALDLPDGAARRARR